MEYTVNIITNYLEDGQCFYKIPSVGDKGIVFLIHGLGVRSASMHALGRSLAKNGYTVFNYDYPTSKCSIPEHAKIFLQTYRETLKKENITDKVFFVTHSMGGLILRSAMSNMIERECKQIDAIVMLGPPNKGSKWAKLGLLSVVKKCNLALIDMVPGSKYITSIRPPVYTPPIGIVAGLFDGKVAFDKTTLPNIEFKQTIVCCSHFGLRNPNRTLKPILTFLTTKTF